MEYRKQKLETVVDFLVSDCEDSLNNVGHLELQEDGGYIHDRLVGDGYLSQDEFNSITESEWASIWANVDSRITSH